MICQYLKFFMEYFIRDLLLQQLLYSSENHCRWSETSRRFYIGHWFRILEGGGFFPQKELQMFCFYAFKQSLQSCCWDWETEGERPGLSGLQLQDDDGRNMWRFWTFHLSIGLKTELSGRFLCRTTIQILQPPYCCLVFQAKHNICDSIGGFRRRRTTIDKRLRCRKMSDVELILFSTKLLFFFLARCCSQRLGVFFSHLCMNQVFLELKVSSAPHFPLWSDTQSWKHVLGRFSQFGTTEDGLFLQERCSWGEFWHVWDE